MEVDYVRNEPVDPWAPLTCACSKPAREQEAVYDGNGNLLALIAHCGNFFCQEKAEKDARQKANNLEFQKRNS